MFSLALKKQKRGVTILLKTQKLKKRELPLKISRNVKVAYHPSDTKRQGHVIMVVFNQV